MKPRSTSNRPAWQTACVEPRWGSMPRHTPRQSGRTKFLRFSPRSPFRPRGSPSKSADKNAINTKRRGLGQDRFRPLSAGIDLLRPADQADALLPKSFSPKGLRWGNTQRPNLCRHVRRTYSASVRRERLPSSSPQQPDGKPFQLFALLGLRGLGNCGKVYRRSSFQFARRRRILGRTYVFAGPLHRYGHSLRIGWMGD